MSTFIVYDSECEPVAIAEFDMIMPAIDQASLSPGARVMAEVRYTQCPLCKEWNVLLVAYPSICPCCGDL